MLQDFIIDENFNIVMVSDYKELTNIRLENYFSVTAGDFVYNIAFGKPNIIKMFNNLRDLGMTDDLIKTYYTGQIMHDFAGLNIIVTMETIQDNYFLNYQIEG